MHSAQQADSISKWLSSTLWCGSYLSDGTGSHGYRAKGIRELQIALWFASTRLSRARAREPERSDAQLGGLSPGCGLGPATSGLPAARRQPLYSQRRAARSGTELLRGCGGGDGLRAAVELRSCD